MTVSDRITAGFAAAQRALALIQAQLGGKAPAVHTHEMAQVTGLTAALAGKQAALGFTPADAALLGEPEGIATLDEEGVVPAEQLPPPPPPFDGGTLTSPLHLVGYSEAEGDVDAGVLDVATGSVFPITVTGPVSLSLDNLPEGRWVAITLIITDGGDDMTWPTGTLWPGGDEPALSAVGVDVVTLMARDDGVDVVVLGAPALLGFA